jgi:hypothetical protein
MTATTLTSRGADGSTLAMSDPSERPASEHRTAGAVREKSATSSPGPDLSDVAVTRRAGRARWRASRYPGSLNDRGGVNACLT